MKLSKNLVAVLRNFSTINRSIKIPKGNEIVVAAAGGGVFGRYTTDVDFPTEICIYDVPELLSTLAIFDDPDVEFDEDKLVISGGDSTLKYAYTDPTTVRIPTMKFDSVRTRYKAIASGIRITEEKFTQAIKAASIMRFGLASFVGDGEKVEMLLTPEKQTRSNQMKSVISTSDAVFDIKLEVDKLKMIPADYDLTIYEQFVIFDRVEENGKSTLAYAVVQPVDPSK